MRTPLILLTAMVLVVGVTVTRGPAEQPNNVAPFMRLKLDHAQKVLEGLALEDFALIEKNAQKLSLLSQAANWQVLQTPEYLRLSEDFRRTTDALDKAAKTKNLDGALVAYLDMTMKCVHCHEYVRDTRMAGVNRDLWHDLGLAAPKPATSGN